MEYCLALMKLRTYCSLGWYDNGIVVMLKKKKSEVGLEGNVALCPQDYK